MSAEEKPSPPSTEPSMQNGLWDPEQSNCPSTGPPGLELPPPYELVPAGGVISLGCTVCGALITVSASSTRCTVKCRVCQEVTPIKSPPAGTIYVRCPCNCLLICKSSAQRVACPRPQCKRVIELAGLGLSSGAECGTRVSCGHCSQIFVAPPIDEKRRVRCPQCRKVSFVGRDYSIKHCVIFSGCAVVFAIFAGTLMWATWQQAEEREAIYAVWTFILVLFVASVGFAIYWALVKVSTPVQNQ